MGLDLKILIEGDPKGFIEAIDTIKEQSQQLNDTLSGVGTTAAIAFAAFTGAILGSVHAFAESEKVTQQQEATLKATGYAAGFTAKSLDEMAGALRDVTTFGDETIKSAETVLLKFNDIGHNVFPAATKSALDMATAMGTDASSAAQLLGKALESPTQGITILHKAGVQFSETQKQQIQLFDETGRKAEAQAIIMQQVGAAFGGSAEAVAKGLGVFTQIKEVIGDIAEGVGKEFAPAFATAGQAIVGFLRYIRDSETALNIIARVLVAGAGMAGFIAAVTLGTLAVSKIVTAFEILQVALAASRIQVALFAGAATLGLGLILAFLPEIIAFAKRMVDAFVTAKESLTRLFTDLFQNLGNIIKTYVGLYASFFDWKKILTGDFSGIKAAGAALGAAVTKTVDDAFKDTKEVKAKVAVSLENTDPSKVAAQAKAAADAKEKAEEEAAARGEANRAATRATEIANEKRHGQLLAEEKKLQGELIVLYETNAGAEVIKAKEAQINALKELDSAKTKDDQALAQAKFENEQLLAQEEMNQAVLNETDKREAKRAKKLEYDALDAEDQAIVNEADVNNLTTQQQLRRQVLEQGAIEEAGVKKKSQDMLIKDQVKYGATYAAINQAINSTAIKGTSDATSQLVDMQNSRNSTLKSIGKAAAVTQILIDGVKSAMSIYAGFSTIPIIGPALGVAGAAAAIAFSLEKANNVRSAQAGGIVPGFGSGDHVPMLLEPGEVVVPKALAPNFTETFGVGADPAAPAKQTTEVKINTIIGTEEFVRSHIIPAIKDANELTNANIGVA